MGMYGLTYSFYHPEGNSGFIILFKSNSLLLECLLLVWNKELNFISFSCTTLVENAKTSSYFTLSHKSLALMTLPANNWRLNSI